jgi:DNA modification methylase
MPRSRPSKSQSGSRSGAGAAPDGLFDVHALDVRKLGQLLDPYSPVSDPLISCTITSPPYGNMKNYGHPDQIGWDQPYDEYLVEMRRVFRTLHRHTKMDGSLWVIADTYRDPAGAMLPLPFDLAEEAAEAGWILRETLIWQKDKTVPWSSGGRMRNAFEYVLLFVKNRKHKYYIDRLRDPTELTKWWVGWPERYNPHGPVPVNVWDIPIPVQGSWKTPALAHACPLPPDLVERLVLISTDEGDVVLDPFAGTGVVIAEASRLGRRGIGTEINQSYVKAFNKMVVPEIQRRNDHDAVAAKMEEAALRRDQLITLRALKYPKVIQQALANRFPELPQPYAMAAIHQPFNHDALREGNGPLDLQLIVAIPGLSKDLDAVAQAIKRIEERPPTSKFGIEASVTVVSKAAFAKALAPRKRLYLYEAGRTWETVGQVSVNDTKRLLEAGDHYFRGSHYRYAPILSNLKIAVQRPDQLRSGRSDT